MSLALLTLLLLAACAHYPEPQTAPASAEERARPTTNTIDRLRHF